MKHTDVTNFKVDITVIHTCQSLVVTVILLGDNLVSEMALY